MDGTGMTANGWTGMTTHGQNRNDNKWMNRTGMTTNNTLTHDPAHNQLQNEDRYK